MKVLIVIITLLIIVVSYQTYRINKLDESIAYLSECNELSAQSALNQAIMIHGILEMLGEDAKNNTF
jgi:hypothetical protein